MTNQDTLSLRCSCIRAVRALNVILLYHFCEKVPFKKIELEKLLDQNGSRMMTPPGLQINLRLCVTLTFYFLTPTLTISRLCPLDHLCQLASNPIHVFSCSQFGNGRSCDERMDERTRRKYYAS